MLAVHVSSATTGQEVCVISAGPNWTVHELTATLATHQDVAPYTLVLLHGARPLDKLEILRDLDTEASDALELQLLRKSWAVTVRDIRARDASSDTDSDRESVFEVDVEAHPDCSLLDFGVQVAEKLRFEPATGPTLTLEGENIGVDWNEAARMTLSELGIHPGSKVCVAGTEDLPLIHRGRPAKQSRRSEFLESNAALCLMDQCQQGTLRHFAYRSEEPCNPGPLEVLHPGQSLHCCDSLMRISGLLTECECSSIIRGAGELDVAPMDVGCFEGTRRYRRLVVRDEGLAATIWERAAPLVQEAFTERSKRPQGFGCAQGDWELDGLNPCFRVNSYGPQGFLKPHRDAPYSPDPNRRSLCTLLIPLRRAGRTRFFYPQQPLFDYRGMTLEEELEARGGLVAGFQATDIFLNSGDALLFGQSLLHEGIPAERETEKMLLRTDILVRRKPPIPGVLLAADERKDQMAALRWFRAAQHQDLREKPSNDLYERALSYRYFHPCKDAIDAPEAIPKSRSESTPGETQHLLPSSLLERYPGFVQPELAFLKGPVAAFQLPELRKLSGSQGEGYSSSEAPPEPGSQNTARHLRVSAMYALHLLGHHSYDGHTYSQRSPVYTVNFDPETQQVTAVPLAELLQAAFESRPCHGAIYNVAPRHGAAEKDFEAAVDRTHMALQHGCTHIGQDLLAGFKSEEFVSSANGNVDLRDDDQEPNLEDFSVRIRNKYKEFFQRRAQHAPAETDWQKYLGKLLSDKGSAPGLDLIATALGERSVEGDYNGDVCDRRMDIEVKAWPMNHLVFDFSKHELVVRAQAETTPSSAPYDPEALWLELLQFWRQTSDNFMLTFKAWREHARQHFSLTLVKDTAETFALFVDGNASHCLARGSVEVLFTRRSVQWPEVGGSRSCWIIDDTDFQAVADFIASPGHVFERYEVSLAAIARQGAGFHHAGEMNGNEWLLTVDVEHAGYALSDHTTTVLCGVTAEPQTEATVVWTIYHGLSAL